MVACLSCLTLALVQGAPHSPVALPDEAASEATELDDDLEPTEREGAAAAEAPTEAASEATELDDDPDPPETEGAAGAPSGQAPEREQATGPKGRPMAIAGWTLTGLGGAFALLGSGFFIAEARECAAGCDESYLGAFVGAPLLIGGGVMVAVGLPLGVLGQQRRKGRSLGGRPGWLLTGYGGALMVVGYLTMTEYGIDLNALRYSVGLPVMTAGAALVGAGIGLGVRGHRVAVASGEWTRRGGPGEVPGWTLVGVGGAALASGAVVLLTHFDEWGVLRTGRVIGGALVTVGATLTGVGIPLGVRGRRLRLAGAAPTSARPGRPNLAIAPSFLPAGGGLQLVGSF